MAKNGNGKLLWWVLGAVLTLNVFLGSVVVANLNQRFETTDRRIGERSQEINRRLDSIEFKVDRIETQYGQIIIIRGLIEKLIESQGRQ